MEKLNININKDDSIINDYLYCTHLFQSIPNKISIYSICDSNKIKKFFDTIKTTCNINTDIIPNGNDIIVNEKCFFKINENLLVSYNEYEKNTERSIVTDIIIYYKSEDENENINKIIEQINSCIISYEQTANQFNQLIITSDGLSIEPIEILKFDSKNFNMYYNDSVIKDSKKMIKNLKEYNKGLSIVYGERGVGKTSLVCNVLSKLDKISIFIPLSLLDITINSHEFKNFIRKYKDCIIVIDDCEIFFSNTHIKSNILSNNIVQMVDGISSDMDNIHIIIILNTDSINSIDPILVDSNNILSIIEVDKLTNKKSKRIQKLLGKNINTENIRIVDILQDTDYEQTRGQIGFN